MSSSETSTNKTSNNNSEGIDTNVDNYTVPELMAILGLDNLEPDNVKETTNKYSKDYPSLSTFFQNMQTKLLNYPSDSSNETESNLFQMEYAQQKDTTQKDKITDRQQKISVYKKGDHNTQVRKQLGVSNNYNVPVAQDTLNPTLKNTINRFVSLDSRYRQYSSPNTPTDYVLDLSDPLLNVLSMRMYSYQIPYSWYNIDTAYGNTCLWVIDPDPMIGGPIAITIPSGNYNTPDLFTTAMNKAFTAAQITPSAVPIITYSTITGKITINLAGATYTPTGTVFSDNTIVLFFDYISKVKCPIPCVNKTSYLDECLGWLMGYRVPYIAVDPSGNEAPSALNLNGTKYLILSIDDYNQSHLNNQLVTITEPSRYIKLPNYFSPDMPIVCSDLSSNIQDIITEGEEGLLLEDKVDINYSRIPKVNPTFPRTLTQSQIYSINEIIKNNANNTNYKLKAPTTTNVFSMIPIKVPSTNGQLLVEFGGTLQDNKKIYFGPVNIVRMRVQLLDDKGHLLNLNGADWSITLIAECLYQY